MPYIKDENRNYLHGYDDKSYRDKWARNAGELNYLITVQIDNYLLEKGLSYQTCNDIVGVLDNAKDEFRRRVLHPYENKKIKDNGDIYNQKFLNGGE